MKILEAGQINYESKEFTLEDGQRLIGVKSKLHEENEKPRMDDLVFIIGWLE